ncbi:MAG: hypothetical protein ACRD82_16515 [Blastocatellia bacterium]
MKYKQREARKPLIETLLQQVHDSFNRLRTLRSRVAVSGIDIDSLPDDVALKAFAILGNHDRAVVVDRISAHLALLAAKGLIASTDTARLPTPVLRFYAQIEYLLDGVLDISQRIEAGIDAWRNGHQTTDGPAIRCASSASGLYSQELRLKIHVLGAEWLLVRPEPIFGVAETLLRIDEDYQATVPLSCVEGDILIAAMAASGRVSVYTLTLSILREAA